MSDLAFLETLEGVIAQRLKDAPDGSYTARLAAGGVKKVAQKVGEEAVELVLAAVGEDETRVTAEAADLLYHMLLLLKVRGVALADVIGELETRHASRTR
jgi:phosphoribosyl-AMP cyclohydrolase / phosphoribosyl-ATP pyrophosphohydrolase